MRTLVTTITFLFISTCFANNNLSVILASEVYKNPKKYNKKVLTLTGKFDLSHFETINVSGVGIDWTCRDSRKSDPENYNVFDRLKSWGEEGLDGKNIEIKGLVIIDEEGKYSMVGGLTHIINISYIKVLEKPYNIIWLNCDTSGS